MGHKANIKFLENTWENLKGKPGAGQFAAVLNDYRQLLENHQEKDFLEIGKTYDFVGFFSSAGSGVITLTGKLVAIGIYTLLIEAEDGTKAMIYKSALSLVSECA